MDLSKFEQYKILSNSSLFQINVIKSKETGKLYVAKTVKSLKNLNCLDSELLIYLQIDHPSIVKYYGYGYYYNIIKSRIEEEDKKYPTILI